MEYEYYQLGKQIFEYLQDPDELKPADAVIGFGHFDMKIADRCGMLVKMGYTNRIIFTGGIGSGSTGLQYPEAIEFYQCLNQHYPDIDKKNIHIESKSTNTTENVLFTISQLQREEIFFNKDIKSALLVASPYRQKRVYLTCLKILSGVSFICAPPVTSFEEEIRLFHSKGLDIFELLVGEISRILHYPKMGYIERELIPDDILIAYKKIQRSLIF